MLPCCLILSVIVQAFAISLHPLDSGTLQAPIPRDELLQALTPISESEIIRLSSLAEAKVTIANGVPPNANLIGNGGFAHGLGATNNPEAQGPFSIVGIATEGLPPLEGYDYTTKFPPRTGGRSSYYLIRPKYSMEGSPAGQYLLSSYAYLPEDFSGKPEVLDLVFYNNENSVGGGGGSRSGQIQSAADHSKCLDLLYGKFTSGTELILYSCHGGANQQFRLGDDGLIRIPSHPDMCLTSSGGVIRGSQIALQRCPERGQPIPMTQHFEMSDDGMIRMKAAPDLGFNIWGGDLINFRRVKLYPLSGSRNELFVFNKVNAVADGEGRCAVDLSARRRWQLVSCLVTAQNAPTGFSLYLNPSSARQIGNIYMTGVSLIPKPSCQPGFKLLGKECKDIDECADNNGGCPVGIPCTNAPGGRTCGECPKGLTLHQDKCIDVNECLSQNGGCGLNRECINLEGGSRCGECKQGYEMDKDSCSDVNECATNNGGCHPKATCYNTEGSFYCGECTKGFKKTADGGCEDIDECATNKGGCDDLAACVNIYGGRECGLCPDGYTGNGENGCVDIDECKSNNGGCDTNSICINLPGSRKCTACLKGEGKGETGCVITEKEKKAKPTVEEIAKLTAEKTAERTHTLLKELEDQQDENEKKIRADEAKQRLIASLEGRILDLKWQISRAKEMRYRREIPEKQKQAELILANAEKEVEALYQAYFTQKQLPPDTNLENLTHQIDQQQEQIDQLHNVQEQINNNEENNEENNDTPVATENQPIP